jgi:hypothetical protein
MNVDLYVSLGRYTFALTIILCVVSQMIVWDFLGCLGRQCLWEVFMKLLRTTALTAALITAAVPILTSSAEAWRGGGWRGGGWRGAGIGWRGGGWGWRGAGVGLAAAAVAGSALAASSYYSYGYGYPAYGYGYGTGYGYAANTYAPAYNYGYGTGYGYPAYGYGYGTGYYGAYGYGYHPVARRAIYAAAVGVRRRWR